MRTPIACLLLLIGSLLLAACDGGGGEPEPVDVLMPLQPGNRWEYRIVNRGRERARQVVQVLSYTVFDDTRYARIETTTTDTRTGAVARDTSFARNRTDGLWVGMRRNDELQGGTFYRYPAANGSLFYNPSRRTCVGFQEDVGVEAGSFDAYVYSDCTPESRLEFYAPNLGLIFSGSLQQEYRVLSAYQIGGQGAGKR